MKEIELKIIDNKDYEFLFELLAEREPKINISHKKMPTYNEHVEFISSKPYKIWYIILEDKNKIGTIYLSKQNEIGIHLKKDFQKNTGGSVALKLLIEKNPEKRFLANINPSNTVSEKFFKKNGFKLIQHTYEFIGE